MTSRNQFFMNLVKTEQILSIGKEVGSKVEALKKIDWRYQFLKISVSFEGFRLFLT